MKFQKTFLVIACTLLSFNLIAQGIHFETGTFSEALSKAAKLKKPLYVDVFTTWCGPCKMMAKNYFPNKKVGDYFNEHFVNFQIDAEKGEGLVVAKKYAVTGYPTNLFLDGKSGSVVYRTSGMPSEVDGFINFGTVAMLETNDPTTLQQYQNKYNARKHDEAFLKKYIQI